MELKDEFYEYAPDDWDYYEQPDILWDWVEDKLVKGGSNE